MTVFVHLTDSDGVPLIRKAHIAITRTGSDAVKYCVSAEHAAAHFAQLGVKVTKCDIYNVLHQTRCVRAKARLREGGCTVRAV